MKSPARAMVVGAVGIVCVVLIVSWAELVTGRIMIGFLQLPPVVLPLLFLLVLLNRAVARRAPHRALSAAEIAVAYLMMVLAAMITSRGVMEDLVPVLVGGNYFAGAPNRWDELYFPYIRPWLVPWDPAGGPRQEVARAFYEGYFYGQPIPWARWAVPLAMWLLLIAAVFVAFLCLAALFRRPWVEQERLAFPLVQLPLEMIREGTEGTLFRNRLFWAGFALPAAVFTLNGLHQFYPTLPEFPTEIPINPLLNNRPWSDMSMLTLFGSFAGVGFFFLLPIDLLFSFWFFFLLGRGEEVLASLLGAEPRGAPHAGAQELVAYQTIGAFIALAAYLLYLSRRQWRQAWSGVRAFRRSGVQEEYHRTPDGVPAQRVEPARTPDMLSPQGALLGLVGSGAVILIWLWGAGMSPPVAVLEMGGYLFIQGLVMGRAMAEGGMLMAEGSFTPTDIFGAFTPTAALGPSNLTVLAFTQAMFTRDLRGMPFSGFLDGQKLGEGVGLNLRRLVPVFGAAFVLTLALAIPLHLWLPYRRGAVTLYSYTYVSNATQFWTENAGPMRGELEHRPQAAGWLLLGAGICALLALLRTRFYWWPLHPLGYAMSASWTVIVFWFPMFVAWLLKLLTIRYGGMRLYAAVRPFFLGMIFGEFTLATIWTLISILWDTPVPVFPWP
jgi:hypothetical protein